MADKKELPTFDFFSISMEGINAFLEANASPAEIDDFFANAYVKKTATVMVPDEVITADGKTIQKMTKKKDKNGKVVLNKDGKPIMIPKKKAVPVKDGEEIEKYSHRDAVSWFIEKYADCKPPKIIVNNRPVKGEKKKKSSKEVFANLRNRANV